MHKNQDCAIILIFQYTNIKIKLCNYQSICDDKNVIVIILTTVLLIIILIIIIILATVEAAIVTVIVIIVINDIVVLFFQVLPSWVVITQALQAKQRSEILALFFFFCIQSKIAVKLVNFMAYLPAVKKNRVLSKSKSRCLCLRNKSQNILHIKEVPTFKWHKMKMKNVEPILCMTDSSIYYHVTH